MTGYALKPEVDALRESMKEPRYHAKRTELSLNRLSEEMRARPPAHG